MTNSLAEIAGGEVFFLTGTNTTENHPVIATKMKQAVTKGTAKLIVADPRAIDMTRFADIWLRQTPGTDVALINGLMHVIIEEGLYDEEYVRSRTEGFEEMREVLKRYTPQFVEGIAGVAQDDIRKAARLYAGAKRASIFYAMGITQHITGTDNVKSLANLAMLCGNVGIESAGVNPLRGQNNVQGACDLGALPNVYTGYQQVGDAAARKKFATAWKASGLPDKPGLTATEMIPAAAKGELKAMYIMGENPLVSDADLKHVEQGLKNLAFLVVQDIFLTETAQLADVVLPAACFAEKDGTFTNTERRVQRVRKGVEPPGEARADWEIIADLAARMGYAMQYRSAEDIFAEFTELTPSYAGISYKRLEKEGGIQWPCPTPKHPGTPYLHKDKFVRGKGLFHPVEFIPPAELPDKDYPLLLTTGRVLYHYHTGSMTRRDNGLNFRYPEGHVEVHPVDALELGVAEGEKVRVASRRGEIEIPVAVTPRSLQGTVFIPFHFFEAAANRLTNPVLDPIGKIPEFKVCAVRVEKLG
ncbi:MAG: formate dehydrogenase subunit alpha [Deltaproteobacteria bacterium RBG_16_54_18]|nr:MAG: formate dehydrogenase subunit alpha [Deltaproteobacteria bacterium RBG_16_54_18]